MSTLRQERSSPSQFFPKLSDLNKCSSEKSHPASNPSNKIPLNALNAHAPIDRGAFLRRTATRRESSGEPLEIFRRQGATEQIALVIELSLARQEGVLLIRFDTFGDDGKAQALAKRDDHLGYGGVVGIDKNILDETTINLELIERQPLQV